jgi:hypothetical protein
VLQKAWLNGNNLTCIADLRGGKAILMAGDYEKDLCESLEKIQAKSTALLLEAEKSHMYDSKICTL